VYLTLLRGNKDVFEMPATCVVCLCLALCLDAALAQSRQIVDARVAAAERSTTITGLKAQLTERDEALAKCVNVFAHVSSLSHQQTLPINVYCHYIIPG
jgi:hypothetical protein